MSASIGGLNHITLAVSDVDRSLAFYRDILGCRVRARWADGVYLEAGSLWLCLSRDNVARSSPHPDYTHVAFSVNDDAYDELSARVHRACIIWKENSSNGASTYFLDPDGHKLEIHTGTLDARLSYYRTNPDKNVEVFES